MIGLLGETAALEKELQRLVPGRLAGSQTWSMRGPISLQISAHTLSERPPSTQSRFNPSWQIGVVAEERELRPHAIHIAKREVSMTRTTARKLCGQPVIGPSDVFDQS